MLKNFDPAAKILRVELGSFGNLGSELCLPKSNGTPVPAVWPLIDCFYIQNK